jgi:hypothetical protein
VRRLTFSPDQIAQLFRQNAPADAETKSKIKRESLQQAPGSGGRNLMRDAWADCPRRPRTLKRNAKRLPAAAD